MRRPVLILGTDHRFQRRDPAFAEPQHHNFAAFIEATAKANGVAVLAEESSPQAIAEAEIEESTVQTIARNLSLKHLHCDPDRETRTALGIAQENEIRISAFFDGVSESEIQRRIDESFRKRERYWLEQLLKFDTWPVLFICGANHALPFLNLIGVAKLDAVLVAEGWGT